MKKKFDFSAEIESAEARTNQEYREPESTSDIVQLLDNIVQKTVDIHPPKTGISVHFSCSLP
ncbi:hypothetical protein ACMSDV_23050 [Bacteroides thetaiotaomicron]|uniref:hypothetical protein n=1 Tax=Bacteroides thetaiotaomicron TaxID=818 RepID=UPI0039C0970F